MSYDYEFITGVLKTLETEKRYKHTLGVKKEAYTLGMIFMPEKSDKLALAGLLHDITKDFSLEKQLSLCDEYAISINRENLVPKLLHAKTGCEYAKRIFGEDIVDKEVYDGIYYHTTGRSNMSLFEIIIYLADYIEEGRQFEDCVLLRDFFYDNIRKAQNKEEQFEVLRKTMVLSFDLTIKNLLEEGKQIDSDTVNARNYYLTNKNLLDSMEE
ncbi:MAG: HD domain-containing protein [Ruminococcaceae bacterium]|nr:HD domain-containing protein [Oscillospiraceae bacterium]